MQKLVLAVGVSSISIASFFSVQAADVHRPVHMPSSPTSHSGTYALRNPFSSSSAMNFVGLYGGGSLGYNVTGDLHVQQAGAVTTDPKVDKVIAKGDGLKGAGHVGYNHQQDQLVVGVEGDLGYSTNVGYSGVDSTPEVKFDGKSVKGVRIAEETLNGSVRARAGYEVVDSVMVYATAGVAGAVFNLANKVEEDSTSTTTPKANKATLASSMALGYTGGIGVEGVVADDITARVEYRYTGFPQSGFGFKADATNLIKEGSVANNNSVNLGVSFKL
ncbi:outer membrane protein [Candidatus Liberibacter sp.]|uniref:outer membrane protein n=1 Tax=Candidatus Liberibacter sp. TaxID=34022 RepID=UPI0015F45EAB|nr:outer membrane beta-barrel protein [Candidatus Liberibacter sp.]MBA5723663.1 porin family protein [Candidatus Liberibacter sp.]